METLIAIAITACVAAVVFTAAAAAGAWLFLGDEPDSR